MACRERGRIIRQPARRGPGPRPFRIGNDQPDQMRPPVAMHHRLENLRLQGEHSLHPLRRDIVALVVDDNVLLAVGDDQPPAIVEVRSEEHTSELQSLMRISYAVFCLKNNIRLILCYINNFSINTSHYSNQHISLITYSP